MAHTRADQENVEISGRRAVTVFTVKVLLSAVVMAATTTMFSLFIWTVLPFAVGWSPSVVLTGSMEPSIAPGDIVVTAPIEPDALKLGYVIRFKDPSHSHPYLLHRIIEINPDGTLKTKGDANQSADSTPVPRENVTGVARLRVPVIGLPAVWLRNGQFLQLGLALLAVALAARVLTGMRALVASGQAITAGGDPDPAEPGGATDVPDKELVGAELVTAGVGGPAGAPRVSSAPGPVVDSPFVVGPFVGSAVSAVGGEPDVSLPAKVTEPLAGVAAPVAEVTSPVAAAATPVPDTASPPAEVATSVAAVATPMAAVATPGTEVVSPLAEQEAAEPQLAELALTDADDGEAPRRTVTVASVQEGTELPPGRHRGEGRASWRRDRSRTRPVSRRHGRQGDRVGSTTD
jgi:signal peptidase